MSTTADQIPAKWIEQVHGILVRDGMAARAGSLGASDALLDERAVPIIEVQNTATGVWQPLNLPTNIIAFATPADRDAVLEQLWRPRK